MAATLLSRSVLISSLKSATHTRDLSDSKTLSFSTSAKPATHTRNLRDSKTLILSTYTRDFRGFVSSAPSSRASLTNKGLLCKANLAAVGLQGTEEKIKLLALNKFFWLGPLILLCGKGGLIFWTGLVIAVAFMDLVMNVLCGRSLRLSERFSVGETMEVEIKKGEVLEGKVVEMGYTKTVLRTAEKLVTVPYSQLYGKVIKNKTRAIMNPVIVREGIEIKLRLIAKRFYLPIDNIDKISLITEDMNSMFKSRSYVFSDPPPGCVSIIKDTNAELLFGCYVNDADKNAENDILMALLCILEEHGVELLNEDAELEILKGILRIIKEEEGVELVMRE